MIPEHQRAKRPVSPVLAGPYGHPFHPILVTVPIGAWVASLLFDIASHVVSGGAYLAMGAVWLIGLGVVGAVAAAAVGVLDLVVIPPDTMAQRRALLHMTLNVTALGLFVIDWIYRATGGATRGAVPDGLIALSAAGLGVLAVAGYLGGELAFRYGVRVVDESTQSHGFRS